MGLNKTMGSNTLIRHSWLIVLVLFAFLFTGCGGSEEATVEESQEFPLDQPLTTFKDTTKQSAAVQSTLAQYEKQVQDLRTENTSLKQNIIRLEQENRSLNTRLTEITAKASTEKPTDNTGQVSEAPAATGTEQALPPSQSTYDFAIESFRAQKYSDAVKGFKAIVDGGGQDDLVGRSKYWLGESYFAQKDYQDAAQMFQEVLKMKGTEKKADAQYMLARSYENLGSKAKAKAAYEKVVKNYPMSKNVKSAKARWAKL